MKRSHFDLTTWHVSTACTSSNERACTNRNLRYSTNIAMAVADDARIFFALPLVQCSYCLIEIKHNFYFELLFYMYAKLLAVVVLLNFCVRSFFLLCTFSWEHCHTSAYMKAKLQCQLFVYITDIFTELRHIHWFAILHNWRLCGIQNLLFAIFFTIAYSACVCSSFLCYCYEHFQIWSHS